MRRLLIALLLTLGTARADNPYPAFYQSTAPFRAALDKTGGVKPLDQTITGVTVPHHLLAAELTAQTLRLASGQHPARIILLTPDHFSRAIRPFATSDRDFLTQFGRMPADRDAAARLLDCPWVETSNLFSHEHGVQALLPFLAKLFPGTPVLPVSLNSRSTLAQWQSLADALAPLAGGTTLLVQSTDFSHYLTATEARRRDQETLRVIATGGAEGILALNQPAHLDSKACQWLMTTLQQKCHGAAAVVVDNRNAIDFGGAPDEPRTTSYITQLWSPAVIPAKSLPGEAWYFGGDTHFGRHLAPVLADPVKSARIDRAILAATCGRPLIVNLEGVMLDKVPVSQPMQIGMDAKTALERLARWNVRGVILANNHALDFGAQAFADMRAKLALAHIVCVADGECVDFGPFRLGAASDLGNVPEPARNLVTPAVIARWSGTAPPWFAFFHCGQEYAAVPAARERRLADWAGDADAALVLGSHPHRPSPRWENTPRSLRRFSLGNFLFDQSDTKNTGGLVEVRFFPQGTWAARWIPMGNLYAPQ